MKIIDINGKERECKKVSPDPKFAGFMKVEYVSKTRKGYTHSEWYPIKDFIKNNPTLENLTTEAPGLVEDALGRVSKADKKKLSDKTQNWKENCYRGFPVWISRGKGEGQTRTVISNTHNTIIIDKQWKVVPDKSSQYVISHNVHDPQIIGNTLGMDKKIKRVQNVPKIKIEVN
jgi:hypothetical protein